MLGTLSSPALDSEYQRERATLDSLDTALKRQAIEIRRQKLATKEAADLANVQIRAAERDSSGQNGPSTRVRSRSATSRPPRSSRESAKLTSDNAMRERRASSRRASTSTCVRAEIERERHATWSRTSSAASTS